ncbi:MAG: hypothetical protein DRI36_04990 [Caldiserica bacterium]|nr:MAG: hypothetical protein DRI36_04990 [Caldisericota bacterium]
MKNRNFDYRVWKIEDYIEEVSSESSVPGGGSVLAFCGTLSFSLILMAIRISLKKNKYEELLNIFEDIERSYLRFKELIEEDAKFYNEYLKDKKAETAIKIYEVAEEIAKISAAGLLYIEKILPYILSSIKSDLYVSKEILYSVFKGSKHLAFINLKCIYLGEEEKRSKENLLLKLEEEVTSTARRLDENF